MKRPNWYIIINSSQTKMCIKFNQWMIINRIITKLFFLKTTLQK